ncbi:MAG: hypothetical protein US20_C0005G0014 [Candidatus Pacebacteria bacterium GW2011_GWF1_36_5]|nr:MAG: hypothetical protein US20_C0005G0014 [Candidatus Pacebacteria bacterium GW2011_GWF1_36_5]
MAYYSGYDLTRFKNPLLRKVLELIMDISAGHDHDGVNSKAVTVGTVADDSVTNAKVAAGIDAAKLADGSVSNAEFQYLNGVTSNIQTQLNAVSAQVPEGTPVNAVASSKVLTIDGVAIDGETVTLGNAVYEFCADAAQSLTTPTNKAVDITAVSTKSQGILTIAVQPTIGDYMTIGTKLYTFCAVAAATGEGDISIGTNLATAKTAIVAAINGTDGHNTANSSVTASEFATNVCTLTAKIGGVAGDLIASTSSFTNGGNLFDAVTLGTTTPGVDCTKGDAKTAILAAVLANATKDVSLTTAAGDTATAAAVTKGVAGDALVIGETMAHGAFAGGATALSGGVNGTVGTKLQTFQDTSYIYCCTAANTIADANWRRISLGSAY